jgi:hypothetical protein
MAGPMHKVVRSDKENSDRNHIGYGLWVESCGYKTGPLVDGWELTVGGRMRADWRLEVKREKLTQAQIRNR